MTRRFDGVLTALGLGRRGFFIPNRGASMLPAPGTLPPYPALDAAMRASEPAIRRHLEAIESCAAALERLGGDPPAPRWTQDWFPRLDGAAAYAMVARWRPRRIVEIGSGHSTRFFARAVSDAGCETRITAIDPEPRATLAGLDIEFLRARVQAAGDEPFRSVGANDFVVIDSSHVLMPGTDVDHLLNRVLPGLAAGVLVHFHDIFLPHDYPPEWGWRGYNEQLAVAPLVTTGAYAVEFASAYVRARRPEWLAAGVLGRLPLPPGAFESSFWLRKCA